MARRKYPQIRCAWCGLFCSWDSDYSVPFGGYNDHEPPPEEFFCHSCAKSLEEDHVKRGFVPSNWIPAQWEKRAAKRCGLVRAGPKHAAWGQWKKPDALPNGWVVQEERCDSDPTS